MDTAAHGVLPVASVSIQLLGKEIPYIIKTVESWHVWTLKKSTEQEKIFQIWISESCNTDWFDYYAVAGESKARGE